MPRVFIHLHTNTLHDSFPVFDLKILPFEDAEAKREHCGNARDPRNFAHTLFLPHLTQLNSVCITGQGQLLAEASNLRVRCSKSKSTQIHLQSLYF
jgi:hypothetical protein